MDGMKGIVLAVVGLAVGIIAFEVFVAPRATMITG